MKKILYSILFLSMLSNAQVLKKKETKTTRQKEASSFTKIDNIYSMNGKFIESHIIGEKYNKQNYSLDRYFKLIKEDGVTISLKKNEHPIGLVNSKLYTFIEDVSNHEREYIVYDFDNKGIKKKPTTLKLSLSSSVKVLGNGDLIVSEGGHSGDDCISIYSSNFKQIHNFKPYNTESYISSSADNDYIFFAAQIDSGLPTKYVTIFLSHFFNKTPQIHFHF